MAQSSSTGGAGSTKKNTGKSKSGSSKGRKPLIGPAADLTGGPALQNPSSKKAQRLQTVNKAILGGLGIGLGAGGVPFAGPIGQGILGSQNVGKKKPRTPIVSNVSMSHASTGHRTGYVNPDLADDGSADDPMWDALLKSAGGGGSSGSSGTFKGKEADYIAAAKKSIPGVSYKSQEDAARTNAARGQKDIGSMYQALAAYTAGQAPVVQRQYAASAGDLRAASNDAAALSNAMYGSLQSNAAQGAGSAAPNAAASVAVGQQAVANQNAAHKDALADSLALGLQSALVNNQSQGNAALGWINNSGNAAQLGGRQAQADVTRALTDQLAQYQTLQAQADQQKAEQALQIGQQNYTSDRDYARQQALAAQQGNDAAFDRMYKLYGLKQDEKDKQTEWQHQLELAQLQNAGGGDDTKDAIAVQKNQTSFINAFLTQNGRLPTKSELHQAGF